MYINVYILLGTVERGGVSAVEVVKLVVNLVVNLAVNLAVNLVVNLVVKLGVNRPLHSTSDTHARTLPATEV